MRLSSNEVTLLVIRPDGYIGLSVNHDHLPALTAYQYALEWAPR